MLRFSWYLVTLPIHVCVCLFNSIQVLIWSIFICFWSIVIYLLVRLAKCCLMFATELGVTNVWPLLTFSIFKWLQVYKAFLTSSLLHVLCFFSRNLCFLVLLSLSLFNMVKLNTYKTLKFQCSSRSCTCNFFSSWSNWRTEMFRLILRISLVTLLLTSVCTIWWSFVPPFFLRQFKF